MAVFPKVQRIKKEHLFGSYSAFKESLRKQANRLFPSSGIAISYRPLAIGHWPLAIGHWPLAKIADFP
jgi:hypothetical protein